VRLRAGLPVAMAALAACARTPAPAAPQPADTVPPQPPSPPAPLPAAKPQPPPPRGSVSLTFVGDINLGTLTLPDGVPPDEGRVLFEASRP
jgi:hypothetical protein